MSFQKCRVCNGKGRFDVYSFSANCRFCDGEMIIGRLTDKPPKDNSHEIKKYIIDYIDNSLILKDENGKEIINCNPKYFAIHFEGIVLNGKSVHDR